MITLISTELSTIKARLMLVGVAVILIIAFTACSNPSDVKPLVYTTPSVYTKPEGLVAHFYDYDEGTMVVYGTDTIFVYLDGTIIFNQNPNF